MAQLNSNSASNTVQNDAPNEVLSAQEHSDLQHSKHQPTGDQTIERVRLSQRILCESTTALRSRLRETFLKHYNQEPKELQIRVVELLVKGNDVFLHAGTGFGKTRIAELFLWLHGTRKKPIYLVLNPLDALGDNQVSPIDPMTIQEWIVKPI